MVALLANSQGPELSESELWRRSSRVGGLCHVLPREVGLVLGRKFASFLSSQGTSQLRDLALHLFAFFHHLREE
ncbi:hypothetical protein TIFTF001_041759 [Ficus carica]|uniref:Uncharacterized protein n=1 Tax=Ficus carica TaxID=3494 RepID=A0AA87ZT00_FICCA|nr:hypothetical protein TIFTF001_041759 [Ficus carica]